jgi:predicted permease
MKRLKRLWSTFRPGRLDSDIDDEMLFHMAQRVDENIAAGMSAEDARRDAQLRFGNRTLLKESARANDILVWLETAMQDVRYAVRGLRRSPGFAATAMLSLGLGIGGNTAIFSFVNALLLKRLPVPDPVRLVQIVEYEDGKLTNSVFSFPFLAELDKSNGVFDGVFGRFPVRVNLTADGMAEPLNGEVVTGDYFRTLRVKPALGRLLTEEDVKAGAGDPVCVISYSTWLERFGGDPGIVGRKLVLNAHAYTVVGVTERGFYGPQLQSRVEMQLPVSRMGDFMGGFFATGDGGTMWKSPGFHWLQPLGRLKPGVSILQAQTTMDPVARSIMAAMAATGEKQKVSFRLTDGSQGANNDSSFSKPVAVLMGIVALVLAIACANLAGLLLARANARAKEFAVRLSLGASRWRLVRQLMVESMAIACCGGLLGVVFALWIVQTLVVFLNAGRTGGSGLHVGLDPLVICFTILLSLLTALLFGLAPAWQSARPDVIPELKGSPGRGQVSRGAGMRRALIVFQIALSLTIVFAAGLLTRTLSSLKTIDLGFDPARVITLHLDPAMGGRTPDEADRIFDEILGRLRAQPGIAAASLAVVSPLEGSMISLDVSVPGHVLRSSDLQTNFNTISPDYFKTLNQTLLAGRDFSDRDQKKAPGVAIVNQLFVEQYMPGQNPVGRHFKVNDGDVEIAGVARNARYQALREKQWPLVYMPLKQAVSSGYTLLVRTRMEPRRAMVDIRQTIRSVDSKVPIYDVRELQDQIEQGISAERVLSFLSALFSALAALLCGMGIYGLIAYAVSRRTREIGVRFAIGAQKMDVANLFLRESLLLVAAGILAGIPLALASTRVLKSLLYGIAPGDPITLLFTIAIFAVAGLLASVLPVLKAARIEPVQALRHE